MIDRPKPTKPTNHHVNSSTDSIGSPYVATWYDSSCAAFTSIATVPSPPPRHGSKEWRSSKFRPNAETGDLAAWMAQHSAPTPRRGNDGRTHLVFELDNLYTKVLSGYSGGTAASTQLGPKVRFCLFNKL